MTPRRDAPPKPDPSDASETPKRGAVGRLYDVAMQQQASREDLIFSPGWRTPIVVDLVIGTVVAIIGMILAITWQPIGGGGLGAVGLLYGALAIRRWRIWSRLRKNAAPDTD